MDKREFKSERRTFLILHKSAKPDLLASIREPALTEPEPERRCLRHLCGGARLEQGMLLASGGGENTTCVQVNNLVYRVVYLVAVAHSINMLAGTILIVQYEKLCT